MSRTSLLVIAAAVALLPATLFQVLEGISSGALADEIRIEVEGHTNQVRFSGRRGRKIEQGLEERKDGHSWIGHRLFATELFLHADPTALAALRSVTVQIGGQKKTWSHEELLRTWKQVPTSPLYCSAQSEVLTFQYPEPSEPGFIHPGFWRGMSAAMLWGAKLPLLYFALLVAMIEVVRRWERRPGSRFVIDACLLSPAARNGADGFESDRSSGRVWFAAGLVFVMAALTWLEYSQHPYFTQDDNFAQFLPVILQSCAAVFHGHLPLWNPYQLYGAPTLTLGTYALTYPGTYLSYGIAKFLLHDEGLTIEVFAIMHLLAGYATMCWLLRQRGVRGVLASAGAVCFVLSGFFLVGGRSWFYMLPFVFWVPLLFGTVLNLLEGRFSWWLTIAAGISLGLFFHAGNAQMWIYTVLFLMLLTLVLGVAKAIPWGNCARVIPVLLLGVGLAAPLLIWQADETANLDRGGGQGHSLGEGGLEHVVLPLGSLTWNEAWGGLDAHYQNEVYYCSTLFVLATVLGLAGLLAFQRQRGRAELLPMIAQNVWLVLAFIAFVYALGPAGAVWSITALLPVFNKLNGAVKFIAFFNLFAIIGGALVIQRFLKNRPRMINYAAVATLALTVLHVLFARASFYSYSDRQYLSPPEEVRSLLSAPAPQRFLPVAAMRSVQPGFSGSLALNFSTAAGLISAFGYDPLVEQTPANERARNWLDSDPRAAAKALGISWLLLDRSAIDPPDTYDLELRPILDRTEQQFYHVFLEDTDRVVRAGNLTLVHIPGASPLAFSSSAPARSLPVRWTSEGADVDTAGMPAGAKITVNVLARRWLRFRQNNYDLTAVPDSLGRPVATLMFSEKPLLMRYSPPLERPVLIALTLILMALASAALIAKPGFRFYLRTTPVHFNAGSSGSRPGGRC